MKPWTIASLVIAIGALVAATAFWFGYGLNAGGPINPMPRRVTVLVGATVWSWTEAAAFSELERLGNPAVPYIVSHLSDYRTLPIQKIELKNNSRGAFEGIRHYSPQTVHDALTAILNQITGQHFEGVYNGATPEVRARNRQAWTGWCKKVFPTKTETCEHGT
jgi:hypothetical protein